MLSRRSFLFTTSGALLGAPIVNRGRFALAAGQREYSRRTLDLVQESLVIDMLGLVTLDWNRLYRWQSSPSTFRDTDHQRLLESGINVFHPAVDLNAADPYTATRGWLRDWNVFLDSHPTRLLKIETAGDLARAKEQNRTGVILGFQNSDHFRSVEDVAFFHRMGQRVSQLTYNSGNLVGSGCTEPRDPGLTDFGVSVIREMNRLGMVVDVSHSGDCTTRDAIELSTRPVLVTHSNCRALNPHPRCKPDEAIRRMAAKGGVFGVTGIRRFVRSHEPTTIEHVLDHFDHVARLVGVEHLGLGSDTDLEGRDKPNSPQRMDIDGLDHSHRVYELVEGLIRRRYSDRNIRLILGGNFQRALAANWGDTGTAVS